MDEKSTEGKLFLRFVGIGLCLIGAGLALASLGDKGAAMNFLRLLVGGAIFLTGFFINRVNKPAVSDGSEWDKL